MSEVYDIADRYVLSVRRARSDRSATDAGIAGHDHEMTDFSPDASAAARSSSIATRSPRSTRAPQDDDDDRIAADVMRERLRARASRCTTPAKSCARCASSAARCRRSGSCFDLMALRDRRRLGGRRRSAWTRVPDSLASLEAALRDGHGARRRRRAAPGARVRGAGRDVGRRRPSRRRSSPRSRRHAATRRCTRARSRGRRGDRRRTRELAAFLRDEYAPEGRPARSRRPRSLRAVRRASFNGIDLDLDETYAWGWEELYRIEERDARGRRARSCPASRSPRSPTTSTTTRRARSKASTSSGAGTRTSSTRRSPSSTARTSTSRAPLQRCEAMIAPPGRRGRDVLHRARAKTSRRPGRTWYPTQGQTHVPAVARGEHLLPRRRARPSPAGRAGEVPVGASCRASSALFGFVSGHGEGWALYAERLMGELGYLDDPAYELGMLAAQAMRAVRVDRRHRHAPRARRSPTSERYHAGETWTPSSRCRS